MPERTQGFVQMTRGSQLNSDSLHVGQGAEDSHVAI